MEHIDLTIYCARDSLLAIHKGMKNKEIPCTDESKKTIEKAIRELYALQLVRLCQSHCVELENFETEEKSDQKTKRTKKIKR